jgi:hypothetical protein
MTHLSLHDEAHQALWDHAQAILSGTEDDHDMLKRARAMAGIIADSNAMRRVTETMPGKTGDRLREFAGLADRVNDEGAWVEAALETIDGDGRLIAYHVTVWADYMGTGKPGWACEKWDGRTFTKATLAEALDAARTVRGL